MVNWHFWLATLGIVIYAAGDVGWPALPRGLMWREYDDQGFLVYSFAETVQALCTPIMCCVHAGGALYLAGGRGDGLERLSDHSRQDPRREADRGAD